MNQIDRVVDIICFIATMGYFLIKLTAYYVSALNKRIILIFVIDLLLYSLCLIRLKIKEYIFFDVITYIFLMAILIIDCKTITKKGD
jgi:hypothetical protein